MTSLKALRFSFLGVAMTGVLLSAVTSGLGASEKVVRLQHNRGGGTNHEGQVLTHTVSGSMNDGQLLERSTFEVYTKAEMDQQLESKLAVAIDACRASGREDLARDRQRSDSERQALIRTISALEARVKALERMPSQ